MRVGIVQPIQYQDRGALGWQDMPSECRTPPYRDPKRVDLFYRVPTMKRLCVKAFLGEGDDYVYQGKDAVKIASYIGANIGDNGVPGGVVAYVTKMFIGKKLSEIPEFDPGSTNTGNEPPSPTDPRTGDPTSDFFQRIFDAIKWITDPMHWLAIFSMLLGLGILAIAIIKGMAF
jgi:hypothetical protein